MKNIVSVSGGKDSTATLLLAIEGNTPELSAVFADTGNEHDWTYEHVRMLEARTGVPILWVKADFTERMARKATYINEHWRLQGIPSDICDRAIAILQEPTGVPCLDLCLWKGRFPSSKEQFCTSELKVIPITEQVMWPLLDAGHDILSWQGIRRDESHRRAGYAETEHGDTFTSGATLTLYRPILDWTAEDVFSMHRKHGIEPNPLYREGMGRVGCLPCINCRKDELLEISRRFPEHIDKIREWERLVRLASKRGASTFFPTANGAGCGIDAVVDWSKTAHGGKQFDLFRSSAAEGCMSAYGLCE